MEEATQKIRTLAGIFLLSALCFLLCLKSAQAVSVPLIIQEAIYPGISGVDRAQEPVTVGIPLSDSDGVPGPVGSSPPLSLSGASAGQFRCLGTWPSGHCKWVLVDTLADVAAGGQNNGITLTSGGGNFGGANLATDNGATLTVNTGAATFTIKKANFNVLDQVVVGGTTLVTPNTSQGLVITGPAAGQTTCPPCTTLYSSANDANSQVTIEENGPVKAVIRAVGNHVDGSGNVYMHYTARLYFYKGKSSVKVTTVLRNADYGTANTFATAYKGLQAYELRLTANLGGTLAYSIGTDAAPQTGTLSSGSDSAYLYQGQTNALQWSETPPASPVANSYTTDTGFNVVKNGSTQYHGDLTQTPQGWADISGNGGAGIEIGVYQLAAYYPKSLEFNNGGSDVRIGIWARENSQPIYQAWSAWSIHDLFLNFHATALASPANDFLKFQHYLVAHADRTYYNATGVFPYPMPSAADEDAYYQSMAATANPPIGVSAVCCLQDQGVADTFHWPLSIYRWFGWGQGGPPTQEEFRWSNLQAFIKRGYAGRFLNSSHFYRMEAEKAWPHADGTSSADSTVNHFAWRNHAAELDASGHPLVAAGGDPSGNMANSSLSFVNWPDPLHNHWYGMMDYYFMSGDETIHEALIPQKDYFLNNTTYQGGSFGGLGYTRAIGIEMMAASRFSDFLKATGDPDADAVLSQGVANYTLYVQPDFCVSNWSNGAACTPPALTTGSNSDPAGVSRVRGIPMASQMRGVGWCPSDGPGDQRTFRGMSAFQASIIEEGILSLRKSEGSGWPEYQNSLDLAFGISQWALTEAFSDDGTANWQGSNALYNGFRYGILLDVPQVCPAGTPVTNSGNGTIQIGSSVYDIETMPGSDQGIWMHFYLQYLVNGVTDWPRKMNIQMSQVAYHQNGWPSDFAQYQLGTLIAALGNSNNSALINVSTTGFHDNGGGSYTVAWTPPAGAQSYMLRWGEKAVADSLQFDPLYTNTFGLDPATHQNWWTAHLASNNLSGSAQSFTFNTGVSGLTAANFSIKAYIPASLFPHTSPPIISNGLPSGALASGTTQTTITFNTNVSATCRYDTQAGTAFSSMPTLIDASPATSHSANVTGLSDGHSYGYYVRCQDAQGNTNAVDYLISFQVGAGQTAPLSPGSVIVTAGDGQMTVSWTPVFNATAYNVYWVAGLKDPKTGTLQAANNSPAVIRGLTNGTLYTFAVTAVNSLGESIESAKVVATPSASATPPGGGNPPNGNPPPVSVTPGQTLSVRVYPNPWRSDKHAGHASITFDGLVANTTIKLFTASGHKVKELTTSESKIDWDLKNDSGDKVASGIYLYVVTDDQGDKVKGKVAVIK